MKFGASTACFYPLETEKALDKVIDLGFKRAEIFFNTVSELDDSFVTEMKKKADANGVTITSIHPFSSALENTCIFGEYQRRYDDYIGLYQKHFHASALLGAEFVVIHGAIEKAKRPLPSEHYFDRFASLVELGKREGVTVCQENVHRFRSQSIDFCKSMRDYLKDDFNMVFDIKQSIRAGYEPKKFYNEFKNDIAHIHISDNCPTKDCMPPGRGEFNFKELFETMNSVNYDGSYIVEIYSKGYDVERELAFSKRFLNNYE